MIHVGRSRSDRINALAVLAEQVASGAAPAQSLLDALNSHRAEFNAARDGFEANAQPAFAMEVAAARLSFEAYQDALDQLETLARNSVQDLPDAAQTLVAAAERMFGDLARYDEVELIAEGPTTHAEVNMVARLARLLQSSQVSAQDFSSYLDFLQAGTQSMPALASEAIDLRTEGISQLRRFLQGRDPQALESGMDYLEQAAHEIVARMPELMADLVNQGPTAYAQMNVMLSALREFAADKLPRPRLSAANHSYSQWLDMIRQVAEQISPPPQLMSQLRNTLAVLESLVPRLHSCDTALAAQSILDELTLYTDAAAELARLEETLGKARPDEKVRCVRCGHANEASKRLCSVCQTPLPEGTVDQPSDQQIPIPQEFADLLELVKALSAQQGNAGDLQHVLGALEKVVDANEHEVDSQVAQSTRDIESAADANEEDRQQVLTQLGRGQQTIRDGSALMRSGIRRTGRFVKSGSSDDLNNGVRMIWQGLLMLYTVHHSVQAPES